VCGVGVVRGMSLGCEWICCGAGCGVVRVPFPLLLLNFFLLPLGWACWCVCGWLGWVRSVWMCGRVGSPLLIDVAAPQRGDQVKQVFYKDLAKTATN